MLQRLPCTSIYACDRITINEFPCERRLIQLPLLKWDHLNDTCDLVALSTGNNERMPSLKSATESIVIINEQSLEQSRNY